MRNKGTWSNPAPNGRRTYLDLDGIPTTTCAPGMACCYVCGRTPTVTTTTPDDVFGYTHSCNQHHPAGTCDPAHNHPEGV